MKTMKTSKAFQSQLAQEVNNIKHDPKLIISADKTSNYYRMDEEIGFMGNMDKRKMGNGYGICSLRKME